MLERKLKDRWRECEKRLAAAQPSGALPKPNQSGWIGPIHCPWREDRHPSLTVRPPDRGSRGGFKDQATGDKGSLVGLADRLGVELEVSATRRRDVSTDSSLTSWCRRRLGNFDPEWLRSEFGVKPLRHKRPAIQFPTSAGGRWRVRALDGKDPKTWWAKGRGTTQVVYGLDKLNQEGPIYIVNGECSVWACRQAGVDAVCFCAAETTPPKASQSTPIVGKGRPLRVVYDADRAGQQGALKAVIALRAAGAIEVLALDLAGRVPPKGDVEDLYGKVGRKGLAETLAELPELSASTTDADNQPTTIQLTTDMPTVVDQAIEALIAGDADIYQRGGSLARVILGVEPPPGIKRPPESPTIQVLPRASLHELLGGNATWQKLDKRCRPPKWVGTIPPSWVVSAVEKRGEWSSGVRGLTGIAACPVMRADGSILSKPGYDDATGMWLDPRCPTVRVPLTPSLDDSLTAAETLLELICDFPLDEAYRAAWLAAALTPFARAAITGPCPLTLIDGNIRGAGKTLLADVIGILATGRELAKGAWPVKEEEVEKRITTVALEGDPLYCFDNVAGVMASSALDAALTTGRWKGRVLSESRSADVLLNTVWFGTGNNVALGGDLVRRVLHVRLVSPEEHPERRSDFRHPNLRAHILQHRARYLTAALTILRGWHVAGRPAGPSDWGSYESWSEVVRGALLWLGKPDPADTRTELADSAATEDGAFAALLANWPKAPDGHPFEAGAAQLVARHRQDAETDADWIAAVNELCPTKDGRPNARQLGNMLRRAKARVIGGMRLVSMKNSHKKVMVWKIECAGTAGNAGTSTGYAREGAGALSGGSVAPGGEPDTADPALPAYCSGCGRPTPLPPELDPELCSACLAAAASLQHEQAL